MFYFLSTRSGISLRDMEQCIRLVVRLANNDEWNNQANDDEKPFPYIIFVLIILRLKNSDLYHLYINRQCQASAVMDYLDELLFDENLDDREEDLLNLIECHLYLVDESRYPESPREQLVKLQNAEQLTHPQLLSKRTQKATPRRIKELIENIERISGNDQGYPLRRIIFIVSSIELLLRIAEDKNCEIITLYSI